MQARYYLVFEGGDRDGERVPVRGPKVTIGRKAGNTIVVNDQKISGTHAEIVEEKGRFLLRDLGSTNGTLLDGRRVDEVLLSPEDRITLGETFFRFVDSRQPAAAAEVRHLKVDAGRGRRSALVPSLLALVVAAAGFSYIYFGGFGSAERGGAPVSPVAGNLLPNFSFETIEGESPGWHLQDGGAEAFSLGPGGRSGFSAAAVSLAGSGFARATTAAPVSVEPNRTYRLAGWVSVSGEEAAARLYATFLSSSDPALAVVHGLPWKKAEGRRGFVRIEGEIPSPPGADRATVSLLAVGGRGRVAFDDLELALVGTAPPPPASIRQYSFRLGPSGGFLHKIDRFLLSEIGLAFVDGSGQTLPASAFAESEGEAAALCLPAPEGESAPAGELRFRLERQDSGVLLRYQLAGLKAGWKPSLRVAVSPSYFSELGAMALGPRQNSVYSTDFTEASVSSVVLGEELNRLRIRFGKEMSLQGRSTPTGFLLAVPFEEEIEVFIQIAFEEEKKKAGELLLEGQRQEEAGAAGEALAFYGRILNEFPFEKRAVDRARSRYEDLFRTGLERIASVEKAEEEARFFGLRDAFLRAQSEAAAIAKKYVGSEIAARADAVLAKIAVAVRQVQAELDREEAQRLKAMASGLEAIGSRSLAAELRRYLAAHYAEAASGKGP